MTKLKEGEDYTIDESGNLVFTKEFLLRRGYCCKNGCTNCPYGYNSKRSLTEKNDNK